jgi:type IV pilus assembly protein PilA
MLKAIKQRLDREDEGFTLIELMVVVLIIAILLAIAIPTFLGARNSANARAAQSNLRNALTAEQTYWTNNQQFDATPADMSTVEGALNWTSGTAATSTANQVSVVISTDGNVVALSAEGKDQNCYTILQSNEATGSFTGYNVVAATSAGCQAAIPSTLPTTPLTTGSASAHKGSSYYASW